MPRYLYYYYNTSMFIIIPIKHYFVTINVYYNTDENKHQRK